MWLAQPASNAGTTNKTALSWEASIKEHLRASATYSEVLLLRQAFPYYYSAWAAPKKERVAKLATLPIFTTNGSSLCRPDAMPLLAFGINHKTAPVAIRERVAFAPPQVFDALKELSTLPAVQEAAILSTCNRTEIFCYLEENESRAVVDWFQHYHKLKGEEIEPYIYLYPDQFAVRHLLRVAAGLDSMILGEPQILGQMKEAYLAALQAGTVGTLLGRLFQHTFSVA